LFLTNAGIFSSNSVHIDIHVNLQVILTFETTEL